MPKRRLGKGIDALLQGRDLEQLSNMSSVLMVDIDRLEPNPDQPRTRFNDETLKELAVSIREKGVLQPILAEDRGDGTYIIVAGERRHRAARLAGLDEVPVISHDFSDEEKLEIALVENLQREDLNAIDEALAFEAAMKRAGYTQEQLAARLGKSRPSIANSLRLLRLEPEIKNALADGTISPGHARSLLSLSDPEARMNLFKRILNEGLNVRQAEAVVRPAEAGGASTPSIEISEDALEPPPGDDGADDRAGRAGDSKRPASSRTTSELSPELKRLEEKLVEHLGTRVVIRGTEQKGHVQIQYHNPDDLNQLLETLGITLD